MCAAASAASFSWIPACALTDLPEGPEGHPLPVRQAAAVAPRDDLLVVRDGLAELGDEPALADARHADEGDELRGAVDPDARERAEQERPLVLATDEWRGGVPRGLAHAAHRLEGLPHRHGLGLSLRLDRVLRAVDDQPLRRPVGRCTDEDAVDGRRRLDPCRGVHHVARDHRLSGRGACVERHERLTRRDADPDVEVERVVALVQRRDRVARCERGADGPLGVVLVRRRRAEHRDDGVADELLDGAAVPLELAPERLVVAAQQRTDILGVEALGARGGADEIDEDSRHDLPLLARPRLGRERRAAAVAEPGVVRILRAHSAQAITRRV